MSDVMDHYPKWVEVHESHIVPQNGRKTANFDFFETRDGRFMVCVMDEDDEHRALAPKEEEKHED